jgi:hypothetical protein
MLLVLLHLITIEHRVVTASYKANDYEISSIPLLLYDSKVHIGLFSSALTAIRLITFKTEQDSLELDKRPTAS